ncbi:MAG: hypothetical protein Q8941_02530 [Bacteroidota bacterium]|nr:hypothetical protein [Bacteroidota bacterium]
MKRLLFLIISLYAASNSAFAFRIEYGRSVTISRPVYEDLYIAGGNIVINAPVYGDLIIAGGTIYINDTVANDILLAGGNVTFNGFAGDDIRCAGGDLHILKNVAGDVVIMGGTVTIERGVTVGGLIVSGGDITVDGNVMNNVLAATGKFVLNGTVTKDIDCRGGSITINGAIGGKAILAATGKIIIGDSAQFGSDVRYWSPWKVNFRQSVKTGTPVYDTTLKIKYNRWYFLGFSSWLGLLWYICMTFLMIMIIQYLFSNTMKKAGNSVYTAPLRSLLYGFLFCIAVPVLAVISFVSIIGVPVGLILLFSYIMLILLATAITSVVAVNWLNNLGNRNLKFWKLVFSGLGIFVVLKILTFTPFLGWFIMGLLVFMAFGAILLNVNWRRQMPNPQISM